MQMVGDGTFEKWVALDMARFRDGFVVAPRPLVDLLAEGSPSATTRGGFAHPFDKASLARFDAVLSPLTRRRLKLPITFFVDKETPADAYLTDEAAIGLLRALHEVSQELSVRDGRLWLGHARAQDIARRYANAFQFSYF
jgi:uncharacterized protein (UPF0216 family)